MWNFCRGLANIYGKHGSMGSVVSGKMFKCELFTMMMKIGGNSSHDPFSQVRKKNNIFYKCKTTLKLAKKFVSYCLSHN